MMLCRVSGILIISTVVFVLTVGGCQPKTKDISAQQISEEKPAVSPEKQVMAAVEPASVQMTLKFVAGDAARYKVVMESGRNVTWDGPVPAKAAFEGGSNTNRAEITFTQKIVSVDSNGSAEALIIIDALKYTAKIKDSTMLDFDSSKAQDANNPLMKLIGQSYTIELTASGQMSRVIDVNSAQAAVQGTSPAHRTAMKLLDAEVIKDRHGTLRLPGLEKNQISTGESWKDIKTFAFGLLGTVSYEQIYTLTQVANENDHKIATAAMLAIPAVASGSDTGASRIAKGFDHKGEYRGELKFDSSTGKVEKFYEELNVEWLAVKPSSENMAEAEPAALMMGASRFYSIERIE